MQSGIARQRKLALMMKQILNCNICNETIIFTCSLIIFLWNWVLRIFRLFSESNLKVWYDSLQPRCGRLMCKISGSGADYMTNPDKCILDKFSFFRKFISRQGRRGVAPSVSKHNFNLLIFVPFSVVIAMHLFMIVSHEHDGVPDNWQLYCLFSCLLC